MVELSNSTYSLCLLLFAQLLPDKLSTFPGNDLSQLLWAYAQFGHTPPAPTLTAILTHAETTVATLQPDNIPTLLSALQNLGCQPSAGLLTAAADVVVAGMATAGTQALVELLQASICSKVSGVVLVATIFLSQA